MKIKDGKIWDQVRAKWLVLTPEEWVRQHFIGKIVREMNVENHQIGREVLMPNGKRADIVVYDKKGMPVMIVECKSDKINLKASVFEQIAQYNIALGGVRYITVTNGVEMFCCEMDCSTNEYKFLDKLPKI